MSIPVDVADLLAALVGTDTAYLLTASCDAHVPTPTSAILRWAAVG